METIRLNELAMLALLEIKRNEGLSMKPKEAKREVKEASQRHKIPEKEIAELYLFIAKKISDETIAELEKITGKVEE